MAVHIFYIFKKNGHTIYNVCDYYLHLQVADIAAQFRGSLFTSSPVLALTGDHLIGRCPNSIWHLSG